MRTRTTQSDGRTQRELATETQSHRDTETPIGVHALRALHLIFSVSLWFIVSVFSNHSVSCLGR